MGAGRSSPGTNKEIVASKKKKKTRSYVRGGVSTCSGLNAREVERIPSQKVSKKKKRTKTIKCQMPKFKSQKASQDAQNPPPQKPKHEKRKDVPKVSPKNIYPPPKKNYSPKPQKPNPTNQSKKKTERKPKCATQIKRRVNPVDSSLSSSAQKRAQKQTGGGRKTHQGEGTHLDDPRKGGKY